jgi:hypothetical protein
MIKGRKIEDILFSTELLKLKVFYSREEMIVLWSFIGMRMKKRWTTDEFDGEEEIPLEDDADYY